MGTKTNFEEQVSYDDAFSENVVYDNHNPRQIRYGRITNKGHAMMPLQGSSYKQLVPNDSTASVLDFVADAFRDLNAKYNLMQLDIFEKDMEGNLKVEKAYQDPLTLYRQYMTDLMDSFVQQELIPENDNIKISKFSDFMVRLESFLNRRPNHPILFSSYVKSTLCPPHISGLMIELGKREHGNMNEKNDLALQVRLKNFNFLARKFGFVVPKQAPWCIVANLNSTIMYNYALEYDVPSKKRLVSSYFVECRNYDIDLLRERLVESYQKYIKETEVRLKKQLCEKSGLSGRIEVLNIDAAADPMVTYSIEDWIRVYFSFMSHERDVQNTKVLFDNTMKDCYYVFERQGFETMHDYGISKLKLEKKKIDKYR